MLTDYIFLDKETCPACKDDDIEKRGFCRDCYSQLDLVDFAGHQDHIHMDLAYPLFYNALASQLVSRFKFNNETNLYKPLADLMADLAIKEGIFDRVETIVPVPLHPRSLAKRGYNQAHLLAKRLGEVSGLEVALGLVKKVRYTKEQNKISPQARLTNLKGSIQVADEFYSRRVLLVDDVLTTGATINSIREAFKEEPAHVEALVLTSGQRLDF